MSSILPSSASQSLMVLPRRVCGAHCAVIVTRRGNSSEALHKCTSTKTLEFLPLNSIAECRPVPIEQ